jgi:hypothetical protein
VPPLVIGEADLDWGLDQIEAVLCSSQPGAPIVSRACWYGTGVSAAPSPAPC